MNRIKKILNEKGIKQTWLAEKLGKSFKIVNAYACNRKQPSVETLYEIARLLQVSVKDLLTEENNLENENGHTTQKDRHGPTNRFYQLFITCKS